MVKRSAHEAPDVTYRGFMLSEVPAVSFLKTASNRSRVSLSTCAKKASLSLVRGSDVVEIPRLLLLLASGPGCRTGQGSGAPGVSAAARDALEMQWD